MSWMRQIRLDFLKSAQFSESIKLIKTRASKSDDKRTYLLGYKG